MCPHSINGVKRPNKMPVPLMQKILPQIRQAKKIALHGIGEPLLSDSFWLLLKDIPKDCVSTVNTNLTVLTDQMIEDLFSSNLNSINVSIDSPYKDMYYKIRGYDLDIILENIKKLVGRSIKIYANMTLMKSTIDSIQDFMDLMIGEIGCDGVFVWPLNRWEEKDTKAYAGTLRGWDFNYEEEGLWNIDYIPKLESAKEYAKDRGWKFFCRKET
jgi:MoaA/NifB/PqqE/SkfB family radical SAM enzyme